jgi:hypothetical protein
MEKKGRLSKVGFASAVTSGGLGASSSAHLSIAPSRVMSWMGVAPVAQFSLGPSRRPERFGRLPERMVGRW